MCIANAPIPYTHLQRPYEGGWQAKVRAVWSLLQISALTGCPSYMTLYPAANTEGGARVRDVVVVHDLGGDAAVGVAAPQQLHETVLELLGEALHDSLRILREPLRGLVGSSAGLSTAHHVDVRNRY
jgi:hypothetical protein